MKTSERNYYGVKLSSGNTLICETKTQSERIRNSLKRFHKLFNYGYEIPVIEKIIASVAYSAENMSAKSILTLSINKYFSLKGA